MNSVVTPYGGKMPNHFARLILFFFSVVLSHVQAANLSTLSPSFDIGETVLVAFPKPTIKDDAYIIGIVTKKLEKGDYQIRVQEFVEGHDYGLSCVPIAVDETGQSTGDSGWELWKDTKYLSVDGLEYIVPGEKVMDLGKGKLLFIDRYNIYISYSRWKSNAPVMPVEKLESTQAEARSIGMVGILPALKLAQLERVAYYDPQNGRPFWPYESVSRLLPVISDIKRLLSDQADLRRLWKHNPRNWQEINQSMKQFFLIDAIDKIVRDARYLIEGESLDKADPKALKLLQQQLKSIEQFKAS